MKQQVFNPYLPLDEYVPDAEPHIFGDRVYIYGSHDRFNGHDFCVLDHITYSAPIDDLSDWRYEGVIFKRSDDPHNGKKGRSPLYAPDAIQGPDGKYYLYYFAAYHNEIGVAVCDTPCGQFKPIGYVHHADGTHLGRKKGDGFAFDPGVYVEGNDVYLYTGFGPVHYPLTLGKQSKEGATCCKLDKDMMTIIGEPKIICKVKRNSKGTEWEGHEFFEASSMRKIGDKYYFIYSSFLGHELCYAISDKPDGEFHFGGTIISIGDLVMLDENDKVLRPAILWNDGRSQEETDYLNNNIGKAKLTELTGNIAFAGFTAPKILWVKKHEPAVFAATKKIMLPKDYLNYMLSGKFVTDYWLSLRDAEVMRRNLASF